MEEEFSSTEVRRENLKIPLTFPGLSPSQHIWLAAHNKSYPI